MDLEFTAEEHAFREEVRDFIRDSLPPALAEKTRRMTHLGREDFVTWHRILNQRGWGAPGWPKEYGGPAGRRSSVTSSTRNVPLPMRRPCCPSASPWSAR